MKKSVFDKRVLFSLVLLISIFVAFSFVSALDSSYTMYDTNHYYKVVGSQVQWFDSEGASLGTTNNLAQLPPGISTSTSMPSDTSAGTGVNSAGETTAAATVAAGGVVCGNIQNLFWAEKCSLWLGGWDTKNLGENQITVIGQMIKWIMLLLIIILIYAALASVDFPESRGLKITISIIVGFLATFLITSKELLTIMQGYTGLGVTIAVFLPFLILGAFTIMTARALSPIGIYLQKVMWIIYTVYMFFKTITLWLAMNALAAGGNVAIVGSKLSIWGMYNIPVSQELIIMAQNSDKGMLIVLLVASVAALVVMLSNNVIARWFAKEEYEALTQAERNKLEKSRIYDTLRAEEIEKSRRV